MTSSACAIAAHDLLASFKAKSPNRNYKIDAILDGTYLMSLATYRFEVGLHTALRIILASHSSKICSYIIFVHQLRRSIEQLPTYHNGNRPRSSEWQAWKRNQLRNGKQHVVSHTRTR